MKTASKLLLLREKTIYNLVSKGDLRVFKVGRKNFFTKEEIERYQRQRVILK
ncbi:helix-turn-helix domain-containing protein [Deferribacter autotrophicus]